MSTNLAIVLLLAVAGVLLAMGYFGVKRNKPLPGRPEDPPHITYES